MRKRLVLAIAAAAAAVLAVRKSCPADGVGLSHYILMDEKKAQ